jgi:hypothetical protein
MKCVKNSKGIKEFRRVSDDEAFALVQTQGWVYCPKSEWKKDRASA